MSLPFPTNEPPANAGLARTTGLWLIGASVAMALYLASFTVKAGEVAVVARFGDPRRLVEEPGLHFKWPAPVDTLFRVDTRTHVLDPVIEEFLTSDQKNVKVDAFVAWRVSDPQQFLTSLRDRTGAEEKIGQVLQSSLNGVIRSGLFSDLVSLEYELVPDEEGTSEGTEKAPVRRRNDGRDLAQVRADVTAAVRQRCKDAGYGVEIEMAGIERLNFPQDNRDKVERAMRLSRERISREFEAKSREETETTKTEASRKAATLRTEAEASATLTSGTSIAKAKKIETDARAHNPALFDLVSRYDTGQLALRNSDLILSNQHWLARLFDDPGSPVEQPADAGTSKAKEDQE